MIELRGGVLIVGSTPVANPSRDLSSGEVEALTLALDLLTMCHLWELEAQPQRLLLLDEPDPHLHPDLQVRFAKFLTHLMDRFETQAIVATHSTTLLAAIGHEGGDRVGVVYLNNATGEQKAISFTNEFKRLATVLGGHALVAPLFGAPLLLVEGDDDYRIWSHVPRQPGYRSLFAVVPCDGEQIKAHQELLEAMFGALRSKNEEPAGYVLLDGDKSVPTHSPAQHVRYLRLACREAENLYLTNEVLASMKLVWDDAQEAITNNAGDYGEKAVALRECANWDRKQVDLKGLIDSIADILDPKKLHWTVRVGQTIGRREPRNEMADFLGAETVNALWPTVV